MRCVRELFSFLLAFDCFYVCSKVPSLRCSGSSPSSDKNRRKEEVEVDERNRRKEANQEKKGSLPKGGVVCSIA